MSRQKVKHWNIPGPWYLNSIGAIVIVMIVWHKTFYQLHFESLGKKKRKDRLLLTQARNPEARRMGIYGWMSLRILNLQGPGHVMLANGFTFPLKREKPPLAWRACSDFT